MQYSYYVRKSITFLTFKKQTMRHLNEQILSHAEKLPEGATLTAKALLHLGNRAAIDQTLSRLVKQGQLIRASRGTYVRPVTTKFGTRPPALEKVIQEFALHRGETVVAHGAAAANMLGLTTQVPVKPIYLTSGRSRRLKLGAQFIELRHAPSWQLTLPNSRSGDVIRALAWLGPEQAGTALQTLRRKLDQTEIEKLIAARGHLPIWMARELSALLPADD